MNNEIAKKIQELRGMESQAQYLQKQLQSICKRPGCP